MPPRKFLKMHTLRLNLVLSEAQNCYAKDRLLKSAVREISLAVHTTFVFLKLSSYLGRSRAPFDPPYLPLGIT